MPMPRQTRQATRRWPSPVITTCKDLIVRVEARMRGDEVDQRTTMVAMAAEMKNARSICTLVKRMNHLLRVPSLSSPVLSVDV